VRQENEPSVAVDSVAKQVVDAALTVHRTLGPGLLESVYEQCLCLELADRGVRFERQKALAITYRQHDLPNALRLDLIVEDAIIVEAKAVETLLPIHRAQLLTYLRLTALQVGLLINFNVPLLKDGIRRLVQSST
jgi:GxxExxY protein